MTTAVEEPRIKMREPRMRPARLKKPRIDIADQAAKTIGARLRVLRKSQKIRLMELAKTTGVDIATISRIENGIMTGTLESHIKLITALGYKLTDLYAGIEEARIRDAVTFQPPSRRREAYVHEAGKSSMAMLTSEVLKKKLMPMLIAIEPGGGTNKEEARVGTEKFLYLLEGELEAKVGDNLYHLKKGSSLYLDASVPHQLKNPGSRSAQCLAVVTPPAL